MSRRRPPIDPQGHFEHVARVPAAIKCGTCNALRLKDRPWPGPCPGPTHRAETPLVVAIPTTQAEIHRGFHRGVTKPGG
jgi:hypothetical protein